MRYVRFISSATLRIAWSRPKPASTQTTIRSRASGKARKIACLRLRPRSSTTQIGQIEEQSPARPTDQISDFWLTPRSDVIDAAAEEQPGDQAGELQAQEDAAGRFAAESGDGQLGLQFAEFRFVFRLQGFGQRRGGLFQDAGEGAGLLQGAFAGGLAAFARVLQFFEPFQGARLARGQEIQPPPRQRGEDAEHRQRHDVVQRGVGEKETCVTL